MGRLINGPNGPFIGKAGSYIGYVVNGVGYIKGNYKPRSKPPTEDEALNRQKFAVAQAWLAPLIQHLRIGFKGYKERFQGFAAAKSYLLRNALMIVDKQIVIDPELVKISYGNLPLPENIECTILEPNILRITWTPSSSAKYRYDRANAMAYDIENAKPYGEFYGKNRDSGEQLIKVQLAVSKMVHVYLAFTAADGSRQSDSVYLGKFEF